VYCTRSAIPQALSLEREEFMQGLGLCFTVSTIVLGWSWLAPGHLIPARAYIRSSPSSPLWAE
jgi:hypothetical protein